MGALFNCLAALLPKFILCLMFGIIVVPATFSSSKSLYLTQLNPRFSPLLMD